MLVHARSVVKLAALFSPFYGPGSVCLPVLESNGFCGEIGRLLAPS